MEPTSRVAADLAGLTGRAVTIEQSVVTAESPLAIDGLDGDVELQALGWYAPRAGDPVLVARWGSTAVVLGSTVPNWSPSPIGTVISYVAGQDTVAVAVDGATQALQKTKAWTPVAGEKCLVSWTPTTSGGVQTWTGVAVGAIGASPAPSPVVKPTQPVVVATKPPAVVKPTTGTTTVLATVTGTWRSGAWRSDTAKVVQGIWSGKQNLGYWFYGRRLSTWHGVTVTSAKIWLHASTGGAYAATPVNLYRHTAAAKTGARPTTAGGQVAAPSLADNASGWYTLPTSVVQELIDSGGGLAALGSTYTTLLGIAGSPRDARSGAIQFTWRKG